MAKQCVGCSNWKDEEEFYASSTTEDGLNRYCKWCCKVNRALEGVRKRDRSSKISYRQYYRGCQLGVESDRSITLVQVFRQSLGICAVCKEWVQPRHASIDHTHPFALGGTHTWDNVQLVHVKCNLRKGDRI